MLFDSSSLMSSPKHSLRYVATCALLVIDQLYACYATTDEDSDEHYMLNEEMLYLYDLPAVKQWLGL